MKNILVIGSINMDMVINTPVLPKLGETLIGNGFMTSGGGKGANQATAIAKINGSTNMIGAVGNDEFGKSLKANLQSYGVNTDGIAEIECNTGVAVITVCNGDNHIIVDMGANSRVTPEIIDRNIDLVKQADIVVMQLEIPMDTVVYAARRTREFGGKVLLNPAPAAKLPGELLQNVDILVPNEHEAEIITGTSDMNEAIDILRRSGVGQVIITLGSEGSMYTDSDSVQKCPAFKTRAVDTTAAGDTFIGAYCAAVCDGMSTGEAVKFASLASSITVARRGAAASIPTMDEILAKKGDVNGD
ncbi:MAG: ribokinase [Clostridia bacterium]|nr:ribokinase [Clostridia bacterium]